MNPLRSMLATLGLAVLGAVLVEVGGGRAWALGTARLRLPRLGVTTIGHATLTGDGLAPFAALGLLGVALAIAVAFTSGRGRWVVGIGFGALGAVVLISTLNAAGRAVRTGWAAGVAGSTGEPVRILVTRPTDGPVLVGLGGLLLLLAAIATVRRGREWPALGAAFRVPVAARPDRDAEEPGWSDATGPARPPRH